MADNTIDTLQLEIKSNSDQATKALDNLAKTLYSLNKSFKSTNSGGMRNFAREVGRVSVSIKALSGLKLNTNTISGISKEFQKLGKNLTDIDTNKIQLTSNAIEKVSESLSLLNGLNLKDSKINLTLGALKRLAGVDMSKFDASGIISSISGLSRVPEVSSGVNRFVSSLQKLVNAGEKSSVVTAQLPALGDSLKKVVDKISKAEKISEPINMFVQSLGRLANAGNKTGQTAGQLKNLSDEILKFFDSMRKAPDISEKTIRMTEALARLSSSGGKISGVSNTLPKYFNNITKVGKNSEKSIKKIASGISNAFSHIGYSSNGLKKASLNLGMLLKTALGFSAIRGLWNFAKTSVKLGSDVTEIQNVVDVAFGNMAGMVDEFAKTATEKFGLSELAAKQYSGTMMAMLKSSGVMKESASEMSTTLAGLAGDIASFYNIDTDEAFRKIRSGIAGEIEPLRQLGISMTVANLEAFSLSQGITKSYQAMTQADQVMLRYNYLMWASADAQGDFARTSGNFANQIRLLKLNIQQLGATLGQGLIAAIQPAIQALNKLMSILIKAANAFKIFMYTLMGKKIEGSAGGIVQDISGIGDAGDVAAGGLGDAAGAADKLKKKLSVLPFDQLNQLIDNSNQSSSGGSGSGIGGGIGSGDFDTGLDEILSDDKEGEISEWAKRIRKAFLAEDWEKLGFEIADGLNRGLQKIYEVISWKNVGPKITAFTNAFTKTFNSMVDNFDWELLGKTVGEGVNTVVRTLTQLIDGIKWINIGEKISLGIRGAIKKIKWDELGNLLGDWFMVSWNIFYGMANDFPYAELGKSIGIGLKNAIKSINFQTITDTFVNLFNGIFSFLKNFNAEKPFEGLGEKISKAINNSISKLNASGAAKSLSDFVIGLLDELIISAENTNWELIGKKIGNFLSDIDVVLIGKKIGKAIWKAINAGFELYEGIFETAPLETAMLSLMGITKLLKSKNIKNFTKSISDAIDKSLKFGKALSGSKIALESIETTSPKVASGISTITKAFSNFRFGIENGNVFTGINEGLKVIRDNLSKTQKGVITTVSAFSEFIGTKDSISDLITGSGKLSTNILELSVSAGTASAAMYVALGPTGLVVSAITFLIGAISGIDSAFKEIKAESAMNAVAVALKEPGGIPLEEITNSYKEMILGITSSFDSINEKSQGLETTQKNAKQTSESIDLIMFALQNGSNSAKEKIPELNELFNSLLKDSKSIFEQQYDIILMGISGSLKQSLIDAGYTVEQIIDVMDNLKSGHQKSIEEIQNNLSKLDESYKNGKITYEEYASKMMENYEELSKMSGKTDEYTNAIKNVSDAVDGVNLSKFINSDNTFNINAMANEFETLSSTASDAKESIFSSSDSLTQALHAYAEEAKRTGNSGAINILSDALDAESHNVELATQNVDSALTQYSDKINIALLQEIPGVVDAAISEYEGKGFMYKLATSEAEHVQAALDEYKKNIIDPATSKLDSMYKDLGIEGAGWANKASSEIIAGLFDTKIVNAGTWQEPFKTTLNKNYTKIINDATNNLSKLAKDRGKDTITGFNTGVSENTSSSKSTVESWQSDINKAIHDSVMNYGSPSKKAKEYGHDTIKGYNLGVSENVSSTINTIKTWQNNVSKVLESGVKNFSDYGKKYFTSLKHGMSEQISSVLSVVINLVQNIKLKFNNEKSEFNIIGKGLMNQFYQGMNSNAYNITNLAHNISSSILSSMSSISNSLYYAGRNAAKSFANGFSSIHVPTPHIYTQSYSRHKVGDTMFSTPNFAVSWYKMGGLFSNASVIGVGEAGKEAVLPLENKRTMSMIADSIMSNSTVGMDEEVLTNAVARGFAMAMMNNQQSPVNVTCYAELRTEDNEVLARAVTKGQQSIDYRKNPTPQFGY